MRLSRSPVGPGLVDDVGTTTRAVYSLFGSQDGLVVALEGRCAIWGRSDALGPLPSPLRRHGDRRRRRQRRHGPHVAGGPAERPVPFLVDTGAPGAAQPPQSAAGGLEGAALGIFPPAVDLRRHGARRVSCSWANAPARRSCSALSCNLGKRSLTTRPLPQVEADRFAAFDTPRYVKVAFNIRVEPYSSGRALITTETRTAATDPTSLHRFARYWMLVGPFSALDPSNDAAGREIRR